MPIHRLNHAVLYVRQVAASCAFYTDVLEFRALVLVPGQAAFLQAAGSGNDHDLALFEVGDQAAPSAAGRGAVGLYHLAWEVDTLAELDRIRGRLAERGVLVGASDHGSTKALYAVDPDGLEFEVCWLVPADRLSPEVVAAKASTRPLDLAAEIARYGAATAGGVGVSVAAAPARG
ncbi:MAG TPA: VOC family protein [Verrucomicrobiae bacterium]|nr:VOC family protein [Verrucomicrobiae bacterium]